MKQLAEFWRIFKQYRACHSTRYAARIAYGCAFRGLPF